MEHGVTWKAGSRWGAGKEAPEMMAFSKGPSNLSVNPQILQDKRLFLFYGREARSTERKL